MPDTPQNRLLRAAQNNLIEWRFRLITAANRHDKAAWSQANSHYQFWKAQVARLVAKQTNISAAAE